MGKVKWGGQALADAIDEHEDTYDYQPYDGPKPPKGVYQFKVVKLEKATSTNGFPQLVVHLELVPRVGRPDEKQYDGYYMRDYIIVKDDGSTAFRVRPFLDAIGVTAKQFVGATMADEEGVVQKIGPKKITGADLLVVGNIWPQKNNNEYNNIKYLGASDGADDTAGSDDTGDTDDSDPPF